MLFSLMLAVAAEYSTEYGSLLLTVNDDKY